MEHYRHKKQKKKQTENKVVKTELQLAMEFIDSI
jgi:hypothetical protein